MDDAEELAKTTLEADYPSHRAYVWEIRGHDLRLSRQRDVKSYMNELLDVIRGHRESTGPEGTSHDDVD